MAIKSSLFSILTVGVSEAVGDAHKTQTSDKPCHPLFMGDLCGGCDVQRSRAGTLFSFHHDRW